MKKSFVFALVMLALLLCVAGCGTQRADFSNGDKAGLVFNKKYIHEEDISMEEGQQTYFMFLSDGTGKYHTYFQYEYSEYNETYSYTVTFRFDIISWKIRCTVFTNPYNTTTFTTRGILSQQIGIIPFCRAKNF